MQLIDATRFWQKMRKSLGSKRVYMTDAQIEEVVKAYAGNVDQADLRQRVRRDRPENGNGAIRRRRNRHASSRRSLTASSSATGR